MKLFGLFQKKRADATKENTAHMEENQLVVIQFFYGIEDLNELHELERQLDSNITSQALGKYEGHDISMDFGDGYLYFNGKNADQIFQCIKPILEQHYFMDKSVATLRFGSFENPAAEERDFVVRFSKFQN